MENQRLINKIKSRYILKHILTYIRNINLKYKIFSYSKTLQKRIDLRYSYCKQLYLNGIGFNINKYILFKEEDKLTLKEEYNNYFLINKNNKEKFEDIIYEVINEQEEEYIIEEDYETKINLNSPLIDIISKTKNFENNFTIYITQKDIDKDNIRKDYRNIFNRLNSLNRKYSSIYYIFQDKTKIEYLNELNIDFDKIKRITLIYEGKNVDYDEKSFFETLFSFKNIENNLTYLKIDFRYDTLLVPDLFNNINNFKSLKYLFIHSFKFNRYFRVKLDNLKILSCPDCQNIKIKHKVNFKELKELNLENNDLYDFKALKNVKFDKLEKLNLEMNHIQDKDISENVIFKELTRLKVLNLENNKISDINVLDKVKFDKLEILNLGWNQISDINALKNSNFKELKELNLYNNNISDINVLDKVKFDKLEILNLGWNLISDINVLKSVNFQGLKELNLYMNKISNIDVFYEVKFYKLEILILKFNPLSDTSIKKIKNYMCMNIIKNNKFKINMGRF